VDGFFAAIAGEVLRVCARRLERLRARGVHKAVECKSTPTVGCLPVGMKKNTNC